jgi:hypothetical protein
MTIDEQIIEIANKLVNEFGTDHIVSLQEIYQLFLSITTEIKDLLFHRIIAITG